MSENQVFYATLPRRVKASIIDGIVVLALVILCPMVIASIMGRETVLSPAAMVAPLLLEPFLISFLGFTLGQYLFGMQVIRLDTGEKCPLGASFGRYLIKIILGGLSMAYMLFSRKHQAIHDHVAKTLVVLSHKKIEQNPEFAQYGDTEQELDADVSYTYPSALKRFGFFCLWAFLSSVALGAAVELFALIFISGYSLETEKWPKELETVTGGIQAILYIGLAVLASKGYLPGAKRKRRHDGGGPDGFDIR